MTPRKVNTLYSAVATEVGVSEELVSDIVDFYWKELKKELESPTSINLEVYGLGTFEIRKRQVEYMIKKYKGIIKYMKPKTYTKHVLMKIAIDKLSIMENLIKLCEEQELKKKQIREIQKNGKTV